MAQNQYKCEAEAEQLDEKVAHIPFWQLLNRQYSLHSKRRDDWRIDELN